MKVESIVINKLTRRKEGDWKYSRIMEKKLFVCWFLLLVLLNSSDGKNIAILLEPDDNLASELEWLGSEMTANRLFNAGAWPRPGDAKTFQDAWPRPGKREYYNEMFERKLFWLY